MPLKLHPLKPADTLSWTRLRHAAYQGPLHSLVHTTPLSESSLLRLAQARRKHVQSPDMWCWKVVDTDLSPSVDDPADNGGRTIAVAIWRLHCPTSQGVNTSKDEHEEENVDYEPPFTPPEVRTDLYDAIVGPLHEAQESIMGVSTPYLELDSLATHPEHQRRGAGRMLLDWGTKKADEEGWRVYLDSSPAGRSSYEKAGFSLVDEVVFDRGAWGGEGKDWWGCMIREVGGGISGRVKTEG